MRPSFPAGGFILCLAILLPACQSTIDPGPRHRYVPVAPGYAASSVNATIFRKNSISTWKNRQVIAFYDPTGKVMLGSRELPDSVWDVQSTPYHGNVRDAHNGISIMHDGKGYLHMAWDHHGDSLKYCRSIAPGSLQLGAPEQMTGTLEGEVTYTEFYGMPGGDLLFLYRDGSSGKGNLVVNRYLAGESKWQRLHDVLIDGEGQRNAYWQACVSRTGNVHLSWTWRESRDASSNHDICYARTRDGGKSWENSLGDAYDLPITASTAEYVMRIPQNSNLINQTSMAAGAGDRPYIATYFRAEGDSCTRYKVLYRTADGWAVSTVSERVGDFILGGPGTRSLPLSRPQLVYRDGEQGGCLYMIFRDQECGNRPCMAWAKTGGGELKWNIDILYDLPVGAWEPSFDTELWRRSGSLHIFLQDVRQGDNEAFTGHPSTIVGILEVGME